ncbi:hypothetical protein ES707_19383 [subsurface metagenome]
MKKNEDFLSSKEVARITGYRIDTIRRFGRAGKLKIYRPSSEAHMKFKRSDVDRFMQLGAPGRK